MLDLVADVNLVNKQHKTALITLCQKLSKDSGETNEARKIKKAIIVLLEYGPDLKIKDKSGQTALGYLGRKEDLLSFRKWLIGLEKDL